MKNILPQTITLIYNGFNICVRGCECVCECVYFSFSYNLRASKQQSSLNECESKAQHYSTINAIWRNILFILLYFWIVDSISDLRIKLLQLRSFIMQWNNNKTRYVDNYIICILSHESTQEKKREKKKTKEKEKKKSKCKLCCMRIKNSSICITIEIRFFF